MVRKIALVLGVGAVAVVAVALLAGCGGSGDASAASSVTPSASTAVVPTATAGDWEAQARMLGTALRDVEDQVPTIAEPPAGEKPEGMYSALIVGVDLAKRTVTIDRCQVVSGEDAVSLAEQSDGRGEATRVVNKRTERLTIPVAPDVPFVVFYPGEGAKNVSPESFAAMSALSFEQFAEFYQTPRGKDTLATVGGWVSVSEGRVTSFVEPVTGTS